VALHGFFMPFDVMIEFSECCLVQFKGKRLPASEMFAGACTEAFYQLEHGLWCKMFLTGYS
jgi:hypothetical protein